MLASMVVVLPSEHTGGDLLVFHRGESKKFCSSEEANDLNFFAFYSDCPHQLKEVAEGHRVALSYQLFTETSSNKKQPLPIDKIALEDIKKKITSYFKKTIRPGKREEFLLSKSQDKYPIKNQKFVFLLNHEYTPKGMGADALKGIDNIHFEIFQKVAEELKLNIYLALADIRENWSCGYEDEWEEESSAYPEQRMFNLILLKHWKNVKREPIYSGEVYCNDNEVFQSKPNKILKPYRSKHTEWMGNDGNTLDRWYHRGAIVMWPQKMHCQAIFGANIDFFISLAEEAIKQNADNVFIDIAKELAKRNMDFEEKKRIFIKLLKFSRRVKRKEQAFDLLSLFDINTIDHLSIPFFSLLTKVHGCDWSLDILKKWHSNTTPEDILEHNEYYFPELVDKLLMQDRQFWIHALAQINKTNTQIYFKFSLKEKKYNREDREWYENKRICNGWMYLENAIKLDDEKTADDIINFFCMEKTLFFSKGLKNILEELQDMERPYKKGIAHIQKHVF